MASREYRYAGWLAGWSLLVLCACATGPRPAPVTAQHCRFVAIERQAGAGEVAAPVDSLAFVLRVRPGQSAPAQGIVMVRREQRDDLESRLRAHPDLLCTPESGHPDRYLIAIPEEDEAATPAAAAPSTGGGASD